MLSRRELILSGASLAASPVLATPFRNPYAFPGTRPGVPLNHIAIKNPDTQAINRIGLKFSGVAIPGQSNFKRIDQPGTATIVSTPSNTMTNFGPCFSNSSTSTGLYFIIKSGSAVGLGSGYTSVVIASSNGTQGANGYLLAATNTGANGIGLKNAATTFSPGFWSGGSGFTDISAGLGTIAQNVPVFFVVSVSINGSFPYNALMMNLLTGATTTTSGTTSKPTEEAGDDDVGIGITSSAVQGVHANIAAAAVTRAYLTLAELKQWAADPWGFWYPQTVSNLIAASVANPSGNATSLRNRAITGVGL